MHLPQSEISLVYKKLKNRTPKREVTTLLFFLKFGVFGSSITTPYGPHKK
jgi:hypothetical protein